MSKSRLDAVVKKAIDCRLLALAKQHIQNDSLLLFELKKEASDHLARLTMLAAAEGDLKLLENCITPGSLRANSIWKRFNPSFVLGQAALDARERTVEYLLQLNISPDAMYQVKNGVALTVLDYVREHRTEENIHCIGMLMKHSPQVQLEMQRAIEANNSDRVFALLLDGFDPDTILCFGLTALQFARNSLSHEDCLSLLTARSEMAAKELMQAVKQDCYERARELLEQGATPDSVVDGDSILAWVRKNRDIDWMKLVLPHSMESEYNLLSPEPF